MSEALLAAPPATYRLVLPPQWSTIDLSPPRRRRSVEAFVAARFAGTDHLPLARTAALRELEEQCAAAELAGGLELHLCHLTVGPVVVGGALLVCLLRPPVPGQVPCEQLAQALTAPGAATAVSELPAGRAVRQRRRRTDQPDPAQPPVVSAEVVYHVPVPGLDSLLQLTFTTPMLPLEEPLVDLFDSIAATLRWVW